MVANFVDQNLTILITGAAGTPATVALGFRPGAIAAGDFTGNAAIDLAVTDWDGNTVRIVPGAGNGTFTAARSPIPTGVNPRRIAVADFNADGAADLAITNAGGSSVTVLLRAAQGSPGGNGDRRRRATAGHHRAGFQRRRAPRPRAGRIRHGLLPTAAAPARRRLRGRSGLPGEVGDGPVAIASSDFNRDGLPDVVTANQAASTASVRLRTAAGFVGDATPEVATDTGASAVTVVDANADGRSDLAVANYTDNSVSLLLNSTPPPPPPPPPNLDKDADGVKIPTDCDDNNPAIRPGRRTSPGTGSIRTATAGTRGIRSSRGRSGVHVDLPAGRLQRVHSADGQARAQGRSVRLTCNSKRLGCPLSSKKIRVKKNAGKRSLLKYLDEREAAQGRPGAVAGDDAGTVAEWYMEDARLSPRSVARCVGRARRSSAAVRGADGQSSPASSSGSVTGRRQVKRSQTYAAARPSTGSRPASSGTSAAGPPGEHDVRAVRAAHDPLERRRVRAGDRDLLHRGEVEVHRLQQMPERVRVLRRDAVQQPDHPERRLLVAVLAGQRREPQQAERGGRGAGRDRGVLEVLAPRDQRLVVVRGREEAAVVGVGEAGDDRVRELARRVEPARVERRAVERQERLEQERMVLEVGGERASPWL